MTKKIEQYLLDKDHKPIIDIIYKRAKLPKNRGEKMTDIQFISLMALISSQIIKSMSEYSDIYDENYVKEFLNNMKKDFMEN